MNTTTTTGNTLNKETGLQGLHLAPRQSLDRPGFFRRLAALNSAFTLAPQAQWLLRNQARAERARAIVSSMYIFHSNRIQVEQLAAV